MYRWLVFSKTGGFLCVVHASTENLAIEMAKESGHKAHSATKF